jgi:tRNA threonylcarbamoyladenosine biosynthesis protein TsaE
MNDQVISKNADETHRAASEVASRITDPSILILLSGDLGVGKTEWVRGFVEAYLGDSRVFSPSYSVVNTYQKGRKRVYHVDLYRLRDGEDLESVGFWDLLREPSVILVEWADKADFESINEMPKLTVDIRSEPNGNRVISTRLRK